MIWNIKSPYGVFPNKIDFIKYIKNNDLKCNSGDTKFSFSEKFDEFNFKRNLEKDWLELAEQRFVRLRKKYDYIRLMYSGGKDSRFVLDLAEKVDFKFDEIFFYECGLFDNPEAKNLYVPDYYKENNKFTHVIVNSTDYLETFNHKDWIKWVQHYNINMPLWQWPIQYYVNPKRKFFKMPMNYVDIMGTITPIIWFDGLWKFRFSEADFSQMTGPSVECFLIDEEDPLMFNFYIDRIATELEKNNAVLNWEQTLSMLENSDLNNNSFREYLPEMQNLTTQYQYSKKVIGDLFVDQEKPWGKHNLMPKAQIVLEKVKLDFPDVYNAYVNNTDWKILDEVTDFGVIMTKEYCLNK